MGNILYKIAEIEKEKEEKEDEIKQYFKQIIHYESLITTTSDFFLNYGYVKKIEEFKKAIEDLRLKT